MARWPTNDFSPTFLRNATAYGVSPRLRLDVVLNDLVASAYTHRQGLHQERRHALAPIVHIRDIMAAMLSVLEAPREAIHNETFNVGRPRRTIASANWPPSWRKPSPAAISSTLPMAARTSAATASTATRSAACCPAFAAVDCPQGRTGAVRRLSRRRA